MNELYVQDMIAKWQMRFNPEKVIPTHFDGDDRPQRGVHFIWGNTRVSIQWGAGNYCDNYDLRDHNCEAPKSTTAEIAILVNGELEEWPDGDTVQGYQSIAEIEGILETVSQRLGSDELQP